MASDNRLVITIGAKDLLSPQLGQIRSNIEALGAKANIRVGLQDIRGLNQADLTKLRAQMDSFRDMGSSLVSQGDSPGGSQGILGAALFGNLGAMAIAQGIQMITNGIQSGIGAVQQAAKTQTLGLAQAGDLSSQLGISFTKAKDLVAEMRSEISKMAAELPGENRDYNAISTQISATVAGYSKGNIERFKEDSLELTKRFGILASIRGVDPNMGGSALNRMLSGTMGIGEGFGVNDIFQKNPLLRTFIQEQLKIIGKSEADWKQLTNETRAKILITASKKAVADETVAQFDGTVDSMIQVINSKIFDQDIGLFGFLKKIPNMDNRTGLDAVQGLMLTLGDLGNSLAPFVQKMGLTEHSFMEGVITVVDFFSDVTSAVIGKVNGEKTTVASVVTKGFRGLITGFNGVLGLLAEGIKKLDARDLGKEVGTIIGQGFADLLTGLDWGAIAVGAIMLVLKTVEFQVSAVNAAVEGLFTGLKNAIQDITNKALDSLGFKQENREIVTGVAKNITSVSEFGLKALTPGGLFHDFTKKPKKPENPDNPLGTSEGATVSPVTSGLPSPSSVVPLSPPTTPNTIVTPLVIPKTPDANKQSFVAPNVIINGTQMQNPQEIANAVMGAINEAYGKFKEGSLA